MPWRGWQRTRRSIELPSMMCYLPMFVNIRLGRLLTGNPSRIVIAMLIQDRTYRILDYLTFESAQLMCKLL